MNVAEQSCQDFIVALASKQPTPGGGGAAAFCAALGAALGSMVCNYTVGKSEYADVQKQVERLLGYLTEYQKTFLDFVDADAVAFEPLSKAYGLPKSTKRERNYKREVMEEALKNASEVPLAVMRQCSKTIDILEKLLEIGNVMVISDVGVGVALCKAAAQSASLNVFVNTKLMKNRARAHRMDDEANQLLKYASLKADYVWILLMQKCGRM